MSENDSSESDLVNSGSEILEYQRHEFTIKVEYSRSLEYSVYNNPMKPKSKSKRSKSPNDSCDEDSIRRWTRGRTRQQKKTQTEVEDEQSTNDLLDIIDQSQEVDPELTEESTEEPKEELREESREELTEELREELTEELTEVTDEGLDLLDEDQVSVSSSVRSGPSFPDGLSPDRAPSPCPECRKVFQRAKRMKAPLKDKTLDTNPKSLTCDQWILLKPWRSRTVPDSGGSLSQLIHKLRVVESSRNKTELVRKVCSRPHLFLPRNLRRCMRKPVKKQKKKNWRKRPREDLQDSRVSKQQRLNNRPIRKNFSPDDSIQPITNGFTHSSPDQTSSSSSSESREDSDVTLSLAPVSAASGAESSKLCPKQSAPKRGGFRDLLMQLRGNSSMIIRESTT